MSNKKDDLELEIESAEHYLELTDNSLERLDDISYALEQMVKADGVSKDMVATFENVFPTNVTLKGFTKRPSKTFFSETKVSLENFFAKTLKSITDFIKRIFESILNLFKKDTKKELEKKVEVVTKKEKEVVKKEKAATPEKRKNLEDVKREYKEIIANSGVWTQYAKDILDVKEPYIRGIAEIGPELYDTGRDIRTVGLVSATNGMMSHLFNICEQSRGFKGPSVNNFVIEFEESARQFSSAINGSIFKINRKLGNEQGYGLGNDIHNYLNSKMTAAQAIKLELDLEELLNYDLSEHPILNKSLNLEDQIRAMEKEFKMFSDACLQGAFRKLSEINEPRETSSFKSMLDDISLGIKVLFALSAHSQRLLRILTIIVDLRNSYAQDALKAL